MAEAASEEALAEIITAVSQIAIRDDSAESEDGQPVPQIEVSEEGEKMPAPQAAEGGQRTSAAQVAESPPKVIAKKSKISTGTVPSQARDYLGVEAEEDTTSAVSRVFTLEEHEENIAAMGEVLHSVLDMAAEGKLPKKREKMEFEMKQPRDSSEDLLATEEVLEEEEIEEEFVSPEGSLEEVAEEEETETASIMAAIARRQQLLEEFDVVHDEAQRLRIMNMLLQSRLLRSMRRPKTKGGTSSSSSGSSRMATLTSAGDSVAMAEDLEKELLEAGEVRRELEAELNLGRAEDELRQRLAAARLLVAEKAAQLQQLQDKAISRMRASPTRQQDAERMLRRVWPQLLRLQKERLLHTRASHELESTRKQVAELEVFGPQRSVAAYEQLSADGVKLAENAQERTEQLLALRNTTERDLQQAAQLRETLEGAHNALVEVRRSDVRASLFLQWAREEVLKTKKRRDLLYKESVKLTQQMGMMAHPQLRRDHEEVRRRLRQAQAELEKLRTAYVSQEKSIGEARKLLLQREQNLAKCMYGLSSHHSFTVYHMDAKCGPSLLDAKRDR